MFKAVLSPKEAKELDSLASVSIGGLKIPSWFVKCRAYMLKHVLCLWKMLSIKRGGREQKPTKQKAARNMYLV